MSDKERRLAEVAKEESLLAGFSRVRVAMVLTDPSAEDNPIVYVNSAFERTTGYSRASAIGRNCRFLQGEDTPKRDVDALRDAIRESRDVSVDILNYRATGEPFLNRLIIAPITDEDGEVIYFLGIQKELGEGERPHGDDDVLNKIRQRVQDDLSMVLDTIRRPEDDTALDFDAMSRRLECLQLVYESMELSDSQGAERGIDLGSLLSRIGTAIAHEEGRPGVRFTQSIEPMLVSLEGAVRVSLVVSEVLANAFDHAFDRLEEGLVELRVTQLAAGGLRVVIADDGVGLPSNRPFPDPDTIGGRLIERMTEGLDATLTPVRGAAGTVVMIDVPVGVTEH